MEKLGLYRAASLQYAGWLRKYRTGSQAVTLQPVVVPVDDLGFEYTMAPQHLTVWLRGEGIGRGIVK